jgi:hypothetical protein
VSSMVLLARVFTLLTKKLRAANNCSPFYK